ncbi:MAG: hypothetical protein HKN18_01935 [Silicimonas sp.]|nr:hypothetical protein [Silicimonas sp.]
MTSVTDRHLTLGTDFLQNKGDGQLNEFNLSLIAGATVLVVLVLLS